MVIQSLDANIPKVLGASTNNLLAAARVKPTPTPSVSPSPTPTPAPNLFPPSAIVGKTAVVLLDYIDDKTGKPVANIYTDTYVRPITFTGAYSNRAFYGENYYYKLNLTGANDPINGDVYSHIKISYFGTICPTGDVMRSQAQAAAFYGGVNVTNYNHIIYSSQNKYCTGYTGIAYAGDILLDNTYSQGFLSELFAWDFIGYDFLSGYRCRGSSGSFVPINSKDHCDVGYPRPDPFDILADYGNDVQMSGFHKQSTPAYPSSIARTVDPLIVSQPGTYSVVPIEASSGARLLKIPRDNDPNDIDPTTGKPKIIGYYYLDFHQPIGLFDTANYGANNPVFNGVTVRFFSEDPPSPGGCPDYLTCNHYGGLIDTDVVHAIQENDPNEFKYAPLAAGKVYEDPLGNIHGIKLTTLSVATDSAKVKVEFFTTGQCIRESPTTTWVPTSQWGKGGEGKIYALTLTNWDGIACGARGFTITPTLPTGWSQSPAIVTTPALNPGQTYTTNVTITSSALSPDGPYQINETGQ